MGEIEPGFGHLLSIWWLTVWRGVAIGLAIATPIGVLVEWIFHFLGDPNLKSVSFDATERIIFTVVGLAVSFLVYGMALRKHYLDFRIALLPHDADSPQLPVTPVRVRSFWWLILWRGAVGNLLIGTVFAIILPLTLRGTSVPALMVALYIIILPLAVIWSFIVLRMALKKRYREFRIALIAEPRPADDSRGPEPAPQG